MTDTLDKGDTVDEGDTVVVSVITSILITVSAAIKTSRLELNFEGWLSIFVQRRHTVLTTELGRILAIIIQSVDQNAKKLGVSYAKYWGQYTQSYSRGLCHRFTVLILAIILHTVDQNAKKLGVSYAEYWEQYTQSDSHSVFITVHSNLLHFKNGVIFWLD